MEFMREFPDDEACLQWLWKTGHAVDDDGKKAFGPKCELDRPFPRVSGRPAWDCDYCGHHLHPTAGTIFHKSSTSLQLWFYAMFLVSQTRCGISAKQLEREIGVTYKTAWRMLNKIRNQLMDESDDEPLSGEVEADETAMGGKPRRGDVLRMQREGEGDLSAAGGRWRQAKKMTVFAMVERQGRVRASLVPDRGRKTLQGEVVKYVLPASTIFTDEWPAYSGLDRHFNRHRRIRHSEQIYVSGEVHTQTIEGFFGNLKRGIDGTYHAVSKKWLQSYLNEFTWRYNRRNDERSMFLQLATRAAL
jgi:transposase-like protein